MRVVPWAAEPTAQVIHDCFYSTAGRSTMAPRYVLRHVLDLYAERGWEPVVAPELEFFLVEPNIDSDYPLKPPVGRSGRPETGRQSYSIAAVNEFDPLFDDIYAFCEAQDIEIDTLIHEDGAAQMEINLIHGDALDARRPGVPVQAHGARGGVAPQDVRDVHGQADGARAGQRDAHPPEHRRHARRGKNIFSDADGKPTPLFFSHIAGLQKYLPAAMSLFAPNVNSYRRITRCALGAHQRAVGLRQPHCRLARADVGRRQRAASRIALGGADANPYLAIAASLACGYLGMIEGLKPTEPISGSAYDLPFCAATDPRRRLALLRECKPLVDIFGERFVLAYTAVKENEYETFLQVISSWEREHLLLNV